MIEGPQTVLKALSLLELFDERRHRIGLSEFVKLGGYNKASTLRFLTALEEKGFVEQDALTRAYTLGPAFVRYSHLREAAVPFDEAVRTVLRELNDATQETTYASVPNGEALSIVGTVGSKHVNRIVFEHGETLPLHSTAAGLAYLAYADPEVVEAALATPLEAHTGTTLTSPADIRAALRHTRAEGTSTSSDTFEVGVTGFAAPFFGPDGKVRGAVGVSIPTIRAEASNSSRISGQVRLAARRLTESRGGTYPEIAANEVAERPKGNGR